MKKNNTEPFFTYTVINNPLTTYKNNKRGRPSENTEKLAEVNDHFSVRHAFDDNAFDKALSLCGCYPLLTNRPSDELSIEDAMLAHKNQYKCEHTFRRAKGPCSIEPIYLHTPERIEAFLFLFKIALQMVVLIERTARNNIDLLYMAPCMTPKRPERPLTTQLNGSILRICYLIFGACAMRKRLQ